jgi:hypothetical protein
MFRSGSQRGSSCPPVPLQHADVDLEDRRSRPCWMSALALQSTSNPAAARAATASAAMRLASGGSACISLGVRSVGRDSSTSGAQAPVTFSFSSPGVT